MASSEESVQDAVKKKRDARKHAKSPKARLANKLHANMQEHLRAVDDAVRPDSKRPSGDRRSTITATATNGERTAPDAPDKHGRRRGRTRLFEFARSALVDASVYGMLQYKVERKIDVSVDEGVAVAKASGQ